MDSIHDHSMVTQMFGLSVYVYKSKEKEKKDKEKDKDKDGKDGKESKDGKEKEKESISEEERAKMKETGLKSLGIVLRLLLRSAALLSVSVMNHGFLLSLL